MGKTLRKMWSEINVGDKFLDGSEVVSIHETYKDDCYKVYFLKRIGNFPPSNPINIVRPADMMCLSSTHLLLCDISKCNEDVKKWINKHFGDYLIPTVVDRDIILENPDLESKIIDLLDRGSVDKSEIYGILNQCMQSNGVKSDQTTAIQSDPSKLNENEYWLPVETIQLLVGHFDQIITSNGNQIMSVNYMGKQDVFCVKTDTHRFKTGPNAKNVLTHHNSVTLRNIIFHCLTHSEQIMIALVDLKLTEFEPFKGVKGVVAVANTVREAVEILRIGREVMYKRNAQLAKLGLNDIKDFKPTQPTDEVVVAGRLLKDSDTVEIRKNGEVKTVTVKELEQYLD